MNNLWKLPKYRRNSILKELEQLEERLEKEEESLQRARNLAAHSEHTIKKIQKRIEDLLTAKN